MPQPLPFASFAELRALVAELPSLDEAASRQARQREARLTKPPGSLGRLEELAGWVAACQHRYPPTVERPRVSIFAANHGVARRGVSAYPATVTAQMVQNFVHGGAAINQLCRAADADLRVYELAIDQPTADFCDGPALSETDCLGAVAFGMASLEPGIDLLALGEMGIGNTTAAAAICLALFGGGAGAWTGPGTGVAGDALAHKSATVTRAVETNRPTMGDDPLRILRCVGGRELAAIVGAIIAARLGHVPVLLDGYVCSAAAAVLHAIDPDAIRHCHAAHRSAEPAHAHLLRELGQRPLLDLRMRLGEGSGAALAIPLLRAAVACHTGMATFAEAGVSERG